MVVTGQAGTGKTTWLMRKANECAPGLLREPYQKVLVVTRMHGARRRLERLIQEGCPNIPSVIMTIDSLALSILNRWRMALGHQKPITAVSGSTDFADSMFSLEADFDRILSEAGRLLGSPTVGKIIGSTYPLILVDEFQDCHGPLLRFVQSLSSNSDMLLAADEFQLLDTVIEGCPAMEWAKTISANGAATLEELTFCHRTSSGAILEAARCLRENVRSTTNTIPVVCCPNHAPVAWKILEKLVFGSSATRWSGTSALICPSHDPVLQGVIDSCTSQLQKRGMHPIRWNKETTLAQEQVEIMQNLGITDAQDESDTEWSIPATIVDPLAIRVAHRVKHMAKLRGLKGIPTKLCVRQVETLVHDRRAYLPSAALRTVTTVHGAKNREFDNVFVLWAYKMPPSQDQQRKLLYNAITRSRKNCMVLVYGDTTRVENDPVLSLLGVPEPAFPAKKRARIERRKARARS